MSTCVLIASSRSIIDYYWSSRARSGHCKTIQLPSAVPGLSMMAIQTCFQL